MKKVKQGFTLIEMLVVVLVIGTLVSIALPQYDKAVARSRAAEIWSILPTLRSAAEEYCLANGTDRPDPENLSVSFPAHMKTTVLSCANCSSFRSRSGYVSGILLLGKDRTISDAMANPNSSDYVLLSLYQTGERVCNGSEENCKTIGFTKGDRYCDSSGCYSNGNYRQ